MFHLDVHLLDGCDTHSGTSSDYSFRTLQQKLKFIISDFIDLWLIHTRLILHILELDLFPQLNLKDL